MVYWTLVVEVKFLRADVAGDRYATDETRGVPPDALARLHRLLRSGSGSRTGSMRSLMPTYASLFAGGCYLYPIRSRGASARRLIMFAASVPLSIYWTLQYQHKYTHSPHRWKRSSR